MKCFTTALLLSFFLFSPIGLSAQDVNWAYTHETFVEPYVQITQDTLGDYEWWEYWEAINDWFLDIGFSFEVMDEVVDELEFWDDYLIFVQPQEKYFVPSNLSFIDRGIKLQTLPLTHMLMQVQGDVGERIFILELDNAGIFAGDSSEYVNMQIRLYEADNSIEVQYGPCFILPETYESDEATGPILGFMDATVPNGEDYPALYVIGGDVLNPMGYTQADSGSVDYTGLFGTPPEGTVYRFVPVPVSGVEEFSFAPLSAWWTGGGIKVVSRDLPLFDSYELCDFQGRVLAQGDLPEGGRESIRLSVPSALSPGLYALTLRGEEGLLTKKVFVGR